MNSKQKIALTVFSAPALMALVLWAVTGFHLFTRQQIPVQLVDELLGTTYTVWQDVFIIGLDIAAPVAAASLVFFAISYFAFRSKRSTLNILV